MEDYKKDKIAWCVTDGVVGNISQAKGLASANDKGKAVEGLVPGKYKGGFDAAKGAYNKAAELKKKKDEM